ncbi:hypothetical protein HPB50_009228 [Hyalomma asiaticum]|uniref:Uncharacterized protein n=1 Tax=Hyalomma asiaticum TaxID=266040 RepID=A0ACB7T5B9_HYAAI|nr:hypothetical protein HPB50_009228 [Hyalomma asiaticum]
MTTTSARNVMREARSRQKRKKFVGRSTVEALKKTNGKRARRQEKKKKRRLERAEGRMGRQILERRRWRRVTVVSGSSCSAPAVPDILGVTVPGWVLAAQATYPDLSRLWKAGLPVWLSLLGMSLCNASSGASHPLQFLSGSKVPGRHISLALPVTSPSLSPRLCAPHEAIAAINTTEDHWEESTQTREEKEETFGTSRGQNGSADSRVKTLASHDRGVGFQLSSSSCPRYTRRCVASRCSKVTVPGWVLAAQATYSDLSRLWKAGLPVWLSLLGTSLCNASSGASHPLQFLSGSEVPGRHVSLASPVTSSSSSPCLCAPYEAITAINTIGDCFLVTNVIAGR